METIGTKYRDSIGILCQIGFNIGYLLFPLASYCLRNYHHLQLACLIPLIPGFIWLYWIPESPRWQLAKGRTRKAKMELRKAAVKNKQSLEKLEEKLDELEEHFRKTENLHKKDCIYSMSVVSS